MEIVLNSSGCVLIHEVLILINCLLMMVKWSDLVSGSGTSLCGCCGVPDPWRARPDPESCGLIMQTRSLPPELLVLCSSLQLPDIGSCSLHRPEASWLCGLCAVWKVSLGESEREREKSIQEYSSSMRILSNGQGFWSTFARVWVPYR